MSGYHHACVVCGVRPPAMREIPYCFECWPGGPVSPPPCYKCGAGDRYYASGLCARCHPHAPGQLSPAWKRAGPLAQQRVVMGSCPDCDAWGVTRTYGWVCMGCKSWRETHRHRAACASCRRVAALADDGSCRLCHKQRSHYAHRSGVRPSKVSVAEANRDGQQLFFAGMWNPKRGAGKRPYVKTTMPADMTLRRTPSARSCAGRCLPCTPGATSISRCGRSAATTSSRCCRTTR